MMQQQRRSINILLATLLAGVFAACLSTPALAGVKAQLDRNKVYEGDPVTLIIETDGQHSGKPDLSMLNKDFKVLGNSTSTQVSIINGQRSGKTSWSIQLEPRHKGKLQIPPVRVGSEQTQALELEVTDVPEQIATQQSAHVFLEVEADTQGHSLYVQQQIPYTVKLYYDEQILNGDLDRPQPQHAVVEKLGEDKRYTVSRNNRRYNVIERHYVISAEKSGQFRIPPVTFKGQIASSQETSSLNAPQERYIDRMFRNSPFANDPFFSGTPFADRGRPVRIHSKAITVDIQSRPASAGNTWLPAEQMTLHDSWSDNLPQFRSGEPVTRTITLQAKGLTGTQIPVLQLQPPEQTRLYPESPVNESRTDGDSIYGISKQNITYIPGKAGKLTIPALELSWWNTRANEQAIARLPKREVNVEPGVGGTQTRQVTKPENSILATDTEKSASVTQSQMISWFAQLKAFKHWPVVGAVLLLLIIVLFVVKRVRHTKADTVVIKQEPTAAQTVRTMTKNLMPQFERACISNDAKTAANLLLEMGRGQWPNDPPGNLGALATCLGHGYEQIMMLDRALYAADTSKWEGSDLWNAVKDAWHKSPTKKRPTEDSLKPLYPQSI